MRLFLLLLCCAIGADARAQCLSLPDMRSLLGRTLADDDPFMTSRGFSYGLAGGSKTRWFGRDNGLTSVLTYPGADGPGIDRVDYHPHKSNRCFRTLLDQLKHTPGFGADGQLTVRNPLKQQLHCYKGPDCGAIVWRGPEGNHSVHLYTLAQYLAAKERLSKQR